VVQTLPVPSTRAGHRTCRASQPRGRDHKKQNYHIAVWNVRTLLDAEDSRPPRRTALIAAELNRYNIDIAALRLADEGSLSEVGEGYTFFWKGLPESARRIHGVGFAIRTSLLSRFPESPSAVSERLMTLRVPLAKGRFMTLISAYAPTLVADDAVKDRFYDDLHRVLRSVPRSDNSFCLATLTPGSEQTILSGVTL